MGLFFKVSPLVKYKKKICKMKIKKAYRIFAWPSLNSFLIREIIYFRFVVIWVALILTLNYLVEKCLLTFIINYINERIDELRKFEKLF